MSKVFVSGATGVLGRRAVRRLVAAGHDVSAVVRTGATAELVRAADARPVNLDLFDAEAVGTAVSGHDAVLHLATNIPTGASAATKRGWSTNDRLRRDASAILARAAIDADVGRFVQESITFPYVDGGDAWLDERAECSYFWGNATTVDAERSATSVTDAGGVGVVLRFAMFMATDSAHIERFVGMAKRGLWAIFGSDDSYISFIDVDDAAAAVVAALDAPAGVYNVAEADPTSRGDHRAALAEAVGRSSLRGLPRVVERLAGPSAESLGRSHRISSASLAAATGWAAQHRVLEAWRELA